VIKTCTINASVNELVKLTLEMDYKTETKDAIVGSNIADTWSDPFTFAYGSLEFPVSTTIAEVQSIDLTINRNPEMVKGLGSRFTTSAPAKQIEYAFKATICLEDKNMLETFYGAAGNPNATVAETATMRLLFDNGGATTATRELDLKFAGIKIDTFSTPQTVDEVIKMEISGKVRQWTDAIYSDNTATEPANS
jgi:hypothetical protein